MKKIIPLSIIMIMFFVTSCNGNSAENASSEVANVQGSVPIAQSDNGTMLDFPRFDYTKDLRESIQFSDGDDIYITKSGTYEFSGNYEKSNITVNVNKDIDKGIVYLILNGITISSNTDAPIKIMEAKDVVIILAEGTHNTVTQGDIQTSDEDFPSGAIYSKADTVITGAGSLSVTTLYNDGINCRDDLIIDGSTVTVQAPFDGIVGKDLLAIADAVITVDAGKDGLKTSNDEDLDRGNLIIESGNFTINAFNDAISSERSLQIDGGTFNLSTGGGFVKVLNVITQGEGPGNYVQATDLLQDSMKALKAYDIVINAGIIHISAYEDGLNAKNNIIINGGTLHILAGDDAVTADNALTIYDVDLTVENAYEGLEAPYLTIHGGNITITVLDDAVNGNGDAGLVRITGGNITLKCRGDGIDANYDLLIEGGTIVMDITPLYGGGDGGLDVSGTLTITGGSITDTEGREINAITTAGRQPRGRQPGGMQPEPGSMPPDRGSMSLEPGGMPPDPGRGSVRPAL
ncbi:MAG: carbohydrate-binding domain-containing protein [Spirochaetales bacterium]